MKVSTLATGFFAGLALAQRPADTPMCDYYTKALLGDNTAKNQAVVLTYLVNTVVLGSAMPKPKLPNVTFPAAPSGLMGILAPNATYMGQGANILPYFDGGLASSNRGGSSGVAINFLDGGGAAPLEKAMPANDMTSNQYKLLTHLYQFFGSLLNCTMQGNSDFSAYQGEASMYSVHKYMALNSSQVGYFIEQVGLAATSFGVTDDDVKAVGTALTNIFDVKCAAPMTVIPANGPQLQSICTTSDCKEAANASCSSYAAVMEPAVANKTLAMGEGNSSASAAPAAPSGTSSGSSSGSSSMPSPSTGAAPINVGGILAAGGMAAIAFML